MEILILLVLFSAAIGYWANNLGRNGWAWGLVALLLSPLLVGIVLLFVGKTIEKRADETVQLNNLVKSKTDNAN